MFSSLISEIILYVDQGGYVMWPLMVATFVLWYALGYRFATLRRGNKRSVRILVDRYAKGYKREPSGIIDNAILTSLRIAEKNPPDLRLFLDDALSGLMYEISKYSILVKAIVLVAPLAGLLGTVNGMIEMFDSLADQTFYSQSGGIARGIAEALFTTQMGLAVAVPGLVIGRILEKKEKMLKREINQIKDIICSKEHGAQT